MMEFANQFGDYQQFLGTVHFGTKVSKELAWELMDRFYEEGGKGLDTAHLYGDWIAGERARSEKVVGAWVKERKLREHVVISTKGAHFFLDSPTIGRVTPKDIRDDLEQSLAALGTDWIDLYFLHRDDENVPVSDLLETLQQACDEGKICHYGCSNWTLARMEEAERYADEHALMGFQCNQSMFSLATVNETALTDKTMVVMGDDMVAYHRQTGMPVMAYTAIAKGYFSKLFGNTYMDDSIKALYGNTTNDRIAAAMQTIMEECGCSPLAIELAYVRQQKFPSVPIVSFSDTYQLEAALKTRGFTLSEDHLELLNSVRTKM
jgi:aryl-alcohol dehydrogenase-like predicted oxidoreductase